MTPHLGSSNFETSYFEEDHSYIATLEIQSSLKTQVADGALVIQLETNLYEGEGWVETVTYTGVSKEYVLVDDKKTWEEAEVYCQNQGGHLASIVTEKEENEVLYLAAGDYDSTYWSYVDSQAVWVGGTDKDEEGSWKWSDDSSWIFPGKLAKDFGSNGNEDDFVRVRGAMLHLPGKDKMRVSSSKTGEKFVIKTKVKYWSRGICIGSGKGYVNKELACEAEMTITIQPISRSI